MKYMFVYLYSLKIKNTKNTLYLFFYFELKVKKTYMKEICELLETTYHK